MIVYVPPWMSSGLSLLFLALLASLLTCFVNPVKCNDRIRGVFELREVSKRSQSEILFNHSLNIEIEGIDKPAIVCEWLNLSVIND